MDAPIKYLFIQLEPMMGGRTPHQDESVFTKAGMAMVQDFLRQVTRPPPGSDFIDSFQLTDFACLNIEEFDVGKFHMSVTFCKENMSAKFAIFCVGMANRLGCAFENTETRSLIPANGEMLLRDLFQASLRYLECAIYITSRRRRLEQERQDAFDAKNTAEHSCS